MFRFVSVLSRKIKFYKSEARVLKHFFAWKKDLDVSLQTNFLQKLLVIRIDDIGDYILFRNFLNAYKLSARWINHEITFLGNIVWKELFEKNDKALADKCIWINKNKYFADENYRKNIWRQLLDQKFETVVCASRTRALLLDDLCAVAAGTKNIIGSANTTFHDSWNKNSDEIYTELYRTPDETIHEFKFNKLFAEWCCQISLDTARLHLPYDKKVAETYILCFIGGSTKSRQWPVQYWIKLINSIIKNTNSRILIGGAEKDIETANAIEAATRVENITGKTDLSQIVNNIGNAALVITADTMAAHIGAACDTKTIILSNGNNFYRFSAYKKAGFNFMFTLYAKPFLKVLKTQKFPYLKRYIAVTKDIRSIKPAMVLGLMSKII